jgi:putative ABC transport system permease protein
MITDYFKLAIENLLHRKLRAWLTVLGIVIGIAAVVALVSLGQGLQYTVNQQFSKLGTDKVTVQIKGSTGVPGSNTASMLTKDDLAVVKKSKGVSNAVGALIRYGTIKFNNKVKYALVRGLPVAEDERKLWADSGVYDVEYGRMIKYGDKYKVVIGPDFAKETNYGKPIGIGAKININGKTFTVIGIFKGGSPAVASAVVMTLDDVREVYDAPDEVSAITVQVDDVKTMDNTIENIKKDLRKHRNLKEGKEDFTVQSTKQLIESFLVVLNVITVLLVGLASISLLVGAVGIANTMYTAVLERNREIGVMKAIGARNSQILTIFLIESALIGLIGGIIGMLLGVGISLVAQQIIGGYLGKGFFQVFLPWWLLVGAALFALIIGTLSGIFPAKQAANMHPVDALRG